MFEVVYRNLRYFYVVSWNTSSPVAQSHLQSQIISAPIQPRAPKQSTMADDLIRVLTTQAASILIQHARDQLNQVVNVEDDIHKLITILNSIQATVRDAEKRMIEQETIKQWVKNLKFSSYDIDDALTDWITAIHEVNGNTSRSNLRNKVCLAIVLPCLFSNQIAPLREVAKKIRLINNQLDSIDTAKNAFGFHSIPYIPKSNGEIADVIEPHSETETCSFVDPSKIFGRNDEKDHLLSKLTSDKNPTIVFIWGMGGIGKTTLAQLIFNCVEIQHDFEIKMWVSVGKTFDGKSVAQAIVKQAMKDFDCSNDWDELQMALGRVCDSVNGKKFLLVLDNAWSDDDSGLYQLFMAVKGGAPGSKILITSRNEGVGKKIKANLENTDLFSVTGSTTLMHNLKCLSDEDSWMVFKRFAFSGRSRQFYEELKDIGREISDKCNGLPLAATTIGSLMVLKDTKLEWEHVLDDKIWKFELKESLKESLSHPLLLSYYDLPPPVKRCFCYCANFAKDSKIDAVNLIQIWMSQGYLGLDGNSEMEVTGHWYLNSLVTRSLFQDPERDEDNGNILRCKMHDMIHDLASYLMENECLMVNKTVSRIGENRHLTITHEDNDTFPVPPKNPERLYTFSIQSFHDCPQFVVEKDCVTLPTKFFDRFKYLKTLDMSRNMLISMPNDVHKLKNLRYLNLSHNPFFELPETVCSLLNLQTLKLVACYHLTELPQSIGKLEKLRHLEIDETRSLVKLPKGITKLTSLRTLSRFLISNEDESCSLGDLKHLNHLRGHVKIEGLNRAGVSEAKEAELEKKEHLVDLHINCSLESDVLNALHLNPKLVGLQIDKYDGQRFPSWMACLNNLKTLRLQDWTGCIDLPPLGRLPLLKVLHIERFKALTHVGSEFLGIETEETDIHKETTAFKKLEKLKFSHLENWEAWNVNVMKNMKIMPCLQYLNLSHCSKLQSLPQEVLDSPIKKLRIRSCAILKQRYQKKSREDMEMISHISNVRIE